MPSVVLSGKLKEQISKQMDRKRNKIDEKREVCGYWSGFWQRRFQLCYNLTWLDWWFGDCPLVIQTWEMGLEGRSALAQTEGRTDKRTDMASPRLHPCFLTGTGLQHYILQRYKRCHSRSRNQDVVLRLSCREGKAGRMCADAKKREHHHLILTLTLYHQYFVLSPPATDHKTTELDRGKRLKVVGFFGCRWKNSIMVEL